MQCELIPLRSSSGGGAYREWEFTIDAVTYTIVDEAPEWTLLQLQGPAWVEIGGRGAVRELLRKNYLMLAD